MALVDYVSSDEDDPGNKKRKPDLEEKRPVKRQREEPSKLPPLPSKFHDLYASPTRVSTRDDPSLHGGRTRATPHVDGNWPTHLYIEWYPSRAEHDLLNSLIVSIQSAIEVNGEVGHDIQTFLTSDLGAALPLHISLSRPIGFLTDQKDPFLASFKLAIKASGVRPFEISPNGLDWVPNFENTRWFLVLRLSKSYNNALDKLLDVCNKVVQAHGQPPLYADAPDVAASGAPKITGSRKKPQAKPSEARDVSDFFHISIGWTLIQPDSTVINTTQEVFKQKSSQKLGDINILIKEVKAKIGNIVTNIEFPLKATEDKGILGV